MKSDGYGWTRGRHFLARMNTERPQARGAVIGFALLAAIAVIVLLPAVPEPPALRDLVDGRTFFGIPNFANVVSNLPFLLVGAAGLRFVMNDARVAFVEAGEKWCYGTCFAVVALIAAGSTYYHLDPTPARLMWDRIPIALCVMTLLAATIADRIDPKAALRLLGPLLVIGAASAIHWRWSMVHGHENILPYALVQFGSIAAIAVIAFAFRSRYTRGGDLFVVIAIYVVAKVAESFDAQVYGWGELVSGHTVKHLVAACALGWLLRMLRLRHGHLTATRSDHPAAKASTILRA